MSWHDPIDPVPGTVITVSAYVASALDPIRWLRLLTGNADPPGSSYVVVSTSTTGTSWQKVPADALAAGAALANIADHSIDGDTKLALSSVTGNSGGSAIGAGVIHANRIVAGSFDATQVAAAFPSGAIAGATSIGTGTLTASGQVSAGSYAGGSTSAGIPSFLGANVGASGVAVGAGGVATTGPVNPASYTGGSTSTGSPAFKGITVGSDGASIGTGGVATTGPVNPASYMGGNATLGGPAMKGLTVGTDGISNGGPYAGGSTTGGTDISLIGANVGAHGIASAGPIFTAGQEVYWPGNPPPLGTGAAVPSGLLGYFLTAAAIAVGWTRYTAANGRYIVAAGTSGIGSAPTFGEDANAGSTTSYAHAHTSNTLSVTVTGSAVGGPGDHTGNNSAAGQSAGTGTSRADDPHNHSLNGVSLAVSASGTATGDTASSSWLPPAYSLVLAKKT